MLTVLDSRSSEIGEELFPAHIRLLRGNMNKRILDESWVLFHGMLHLHMLVGHFSIPEGSDAVGSKTAAELLL